MAAETRGAGLGGGGGGGEGNDRTTTRCTAPKHRTHTAVESLSCKIRRVLTLHFNTIQLAVHTRSTSCTIFETLHTRGDSASCTKER